MAVSVFVLARNIYENLKAGKLSDEYLESVNEQISNTGILPSSGDMESIDVDGRSFIGTVTIPALDIELPIQSEWSSDNAKISPCRYEGSVYDNDLIIAAHNYDRHFGRIKNLVSGDSVIITDIYGNIFYFEVTNIEILEATDIEKMEDDEYDLTLFTCTIGGAKRVTVRCEFTGTIISADTL